MTQYSPTQRDRLLDHVLRKQVTELVKSHPGISKGRLRKVLGCAWGTIHHHLRLLAKEGFVVDARIGRHIRYFPPDLSRTVIDSMAVIRQGRAWDIVTNVVERSGQMQSQLLQEINMSRKVLRPHIERLIGIGLIKEVRDDGCCRYHPTPHLRVVIDHMQRDEKDGRTREEVAGPEQNRGAVDAAMNVL